MPHVEPGFDATFDQDDHRALCETVPWSSRSLSFLPFEDSILTVHGGPNVLVDEAFYELPVQQWALLKRSDTLDEDDAIKISQIQKFNRPLYRAYLLDESFLEIFDAPDVASAHREIKSWLSWACRSRLKPFVRLARTVRDHLDGILRFIDCRLTNARLEGTNNKIRLLSHRAYGFHSAESLIATIYLCCSGILFPQPQLV